MVCDKGKKCKCKVGIFDDPRKKKMKADSLALAHALRDEDWAMVWSRGWRASSMLWRKRQSDPHYKNLVMRYSKLRNKNIVV